MIFLIQSFIESQKAKVRAWERARDEWVKEAADYPEYRTAKKYEQSHPRPFSKAKEVGGYVLGGLGGVAVFGLIIVGIVTAPKPKVDPNNPNNCTVVVHKGDKVGVIAGDFDGSKGVIIDQREDCSVNLTLETSTFTMDVCKKIDRGWCNNTKNVGDILNVDKSKNIVKL